MERHFQRDLEKLKSNVIKMGSLVEQSLIEALDAVLNNDAALASKVISSDRIRLCHSFLSRTLPSRHSVWWKHRSRSRCWKFPTWQKSPKR